MSQLFASQALVFAGECLFASLLVMGVAFLAARFMKRASMRHLVWSTAFGVMAVFPIVALIAPPGPLIISHAAAAAQVSSIAAPGLTTAAVAAESNPVPATHGIDPRDALLWLLGVWLIGALWFAARMMAGLYALRVLRRQSRPFALMPTDMPNVAATRQECELRISNTGKGPLTWGIFKPVVLLPSSARAWPHERLHAVLLHELAHVRRRDSFTRILSLTISTLYWPNPLAWLGARALRREAEMAADDAVIESGVKPSAYAGELLQLASAFGRRRDAAHLPLSMAAPSALEARVKSVLAPTTKRSGATGMDVIKFAVLGLMASALMACARPAFADARPKPVTQTVTIETAETTPAPPAALPAPPAPVAAPADAAPPAPMLDAAPHISVRSETRAVKGHKEQHYEIIMEGEGGDAMAAVMEPKLKEAMARLKRDHHVLVLTEKDHAKVVVAMDEALRKVAPEIAKALTKAHPALARDGVDVKVREKMDEANKQAEVHIVIKMLPKHRATHAARPKTGHDSSNVR